MTRTVTHKRTTRTRAAQVVVPAAEPCRVAPVARLSVELPEDLAREIRGRFYVGMRNHRGPWVMVVNTTQRRGMLYYHTDPLQPILHHVTLSGVEGLDWGYPGAGPLDLARSILADGFNMAVADGYYQEFSRVTATLPRLGWRLSLEEIHTWLICNTTN